MESFDEGLSWSKPRVFMGYGLVHADLIKLADGRILCTYRRRFLPFGTAAILSEDNGKTWDVKNPLLLGARATCYGGWAKTLQLPDGTMVTGRAWKFPGSSYEVIRWKLPEPSKNHKIPE